MGLRETISGLLTGSNKQPEKSSPANEKKPVMTVKTNGNMEENLQFLSDQMQKAGFGNSLQEELKKHMMASEAEFALHHIPAFGKEFGAILHFKQSAQGNYFFNNFEGVLQDAAGNITRQTFYQNRPDQAEVVVDGKIQDKWVNSNFNLKEAFNLMEGRSVLKEFVTKDKELYTAWASINFEEKKNDNFLIAKVSDYPLLEEVKNLPIKGIDQEKELGRIVKGLQEGNLEPVVMRVNDKDASFNVAAAPRFRTVTVYDKDLNRVKQSALMSATTTNTEKQSNHAVKQSEGKKTDDKAQSQKQTTKATERTTRSKGIRA